MTKKIFFTAFLLTLSLNGLCQQMPDPVKLLPSYPLPGSAHFQNDSLCYEEGKRLRDTPRGKVAVEDVNASVPYILSRFGKAIGMDIDAEKLPVTTGFINRTMTWTRESIQEAKKIYNRQRPYQYFEEGTPVPHKERKDDFTSYPSGHTIRFWIATLVMTAIAPEYQDEILRTGYEMGQSRVIVGFHYQSDVDAARLLAGACFARFAAEDSWISSLREASEEFHKVCVPQTE